MSACPPRVSLLPDGGVLLDANSPCKRPLLLLPAPPSAFPFLFYLFFAFSCSSRSFAKRISFLRSPHSRNDSWEDSRNGDMRSNPSLVSLALGPEDPGSGPAPDSYALPPTASLC